MSEMLYFYKNPDPNKEKGTAAAARVAAMEKYKANYTADLGQSNYVVAYGGDGTMLDALREIADYKKANPDWQVPKAIGFNYGDVGYLMNRSEENLSDLIKTADTVLVHPLEVSIRDEAGKAYSRTAFNDFVAHSDSPNGQCCHLKVFSIGPKPILDFVVKGNGIVISTGMGSGAYFRNAGGCPFSIDSNRIGLQPICSVEAAQEIGGLYPNSQKIIIDVLNENKKRPVYANTDNDDRIENVAHCEVVSSRRTFPILMGRTCPAAFRLPRSRC